MTVTVIVDDSDLNIDYGPQPFFPGVIVTNSTLLGYAIGDSLHDIPLSPFVGFNYNFTGSEIGVYAVFGPGPAINPPYKWTCSLGNNEITSHLIQERVSPTIIKICSQDGISTNSSQTLGLICVACNSGDLFFDYIEYVPPPASSSQKYPYIGISGDDPLVQYNGEVGAIAAEDGTTGFNLPESNKSITFTFIGSAITAIGINAIGGLISASPSTYSIDSGPLSAFNVTGDLSANPNGSNTIGVSQPGNILFQATNLDQERSHTISIPGPMTNVGLQSFVVANGTLIPNSSATSIPPTTSNLPTTPGSSTSSIPNGQTGSIPRINHKITTHTIVTVTITVVLVAVVAVLLLTWRWIRLCNCNKRKKPAFIYPFDHHPVMFLPAMLTGEMGVKIKARRQVADIIPPDKLRNPPEISSNIQQANRLQEAREVNHLDRNRSNIVRVQAEDSGMRGIEETGNHSMHIVVVPPAYTPV